jgi:indolepyruvate ferredoxin oxidoreductase beta subunit
MNIIIAGVGGQGTILASKLLAKAALLQGEQVRTAETIGMAQRGGSVLGHVRIGADIASPLVAQASANIIVGFEPAETCRALPYLAPGGLVISAKAALAPVGATLSGNNYDGEQQLEYLRKLNEQGAIGELHIIDAAPILASLGTAKALNVVLLGALVGSAAHAALSQDALQSAIKALVKERFVDLNLQALTAGIASAYNPRGRQDAAPTNI